MKLIIAGIVMSALVGSTALAAPIAAEYFDYGPTTKSYLGGLGDNTGGWAGPWSNPNDTNYADYGPTNLDLAAKYTSAQYNNSANVGGMAGYFNNVQTNYIIFRDFSTAQTGTFWLSSILRYADDAVASNEHVMLRLNNETSGGNVDGVGIFNGKASMMYRTSGTDNLLGTQAIATGVYLLLAKVDMNYSGTFDRITMWIDPDLSSGEAGLGAGTLMQEGKNALGTSLRGIGLAVTANTNQGMKEGMDAIRAGTTLADVTSVPEPASLAMLILGGLPMIIRRRYA